MQASQVIPQVGKSYGGVSGKHNLVIANVIGNSKPDGANSAAMPVRLPVLLRTARSDMSMPPGLHDPAYVTPGCGEHQTNAANNQCSTCREPPGLERLPQMKPTQTAQQTKGQEQVAMPDKRVAENGKSCTRQAFHEQYGPRDGELN